MRAEPNSEACAGRSEAARVASEGRVLGIDRSEAMIERARALTLAEGLHNVDYVCAEVERFAFSPRQFDLAISRFGTMFFADAVAASGLRWEHLGSW